MMQDNLNTQTVIKALTLVKTPEDEMSARIAASRIAATVLPGQPESAGSIYYRLKAEGWLSLLLASEPGMSLKQLAERVQSLSDISEKIKGELGGIAGRLHLMVANLP